MHYLFCFVFLFGIVHSTVSINSVSIEGSNNLKKDKNEDNIGEYLQKQSFNKNIQNSFKIFEKLSKVFKEISFKLNEELKIFEESFENTAKTAIYAENIKSKNDSQNFDLLKENIENYLDMNREIKNLALASFEKVTQKLNSVGNKLITDLNTTRKFKGNLERTLGIYSDNLKDLAIHSPSTLITCSNDKQIQIWNYYNGSLINSIDSGDYFTKGLLYINTSFVATYHLRINIWNIDSNNTLIKTFGYDGNSIDTMIILSNGNIASGGYSSSIKIWNTNFELVKIINVGKKVIDMVEFKIGYIAFIESYETTINILNIQTEKMEMILKGHNYYINKIDSFNNYLITASMDESIGIWNIKNNSYTVEFVNIGENPFTLAVLNLNEIVVGDGYGKIYYLKNIDKNYAIKVLEGHTKRVSALKFHPSGELVSVSGDGSIKTWS